MMKIEVLFVISMSLLTFSIAKLKCGINKNGFLPRIIGGKIVPKHAYPWMIFLEFHFFNTTETGRCGGTLINDQWILTAAHCLEGVKNKNFDKIISYFDINDLSEIQHSSSTSLKILIDPKHVSLFIRLFFYQSNNHFQIYLHEKYESFINNDIGLLKLNKKINFDAERGNISPICLPKKGSTINEANCYGVGWGKTETNKFSSKLLQTHMPMVPLRICKKLYPITSNQICAGTHAHTICDGYSSGPLQCLNKDNTWTIEGIISYSDSQCKLYAAFTRVEKYINWINNIIYNN